MNAVSLGLEQVTNSDTNYRLTESSFIFFQVDQRNRGQQSVTVLLYALVL